MEGNERRRIMKGRKVTKEIRRREENEIMKQNHRLYV
jgi:hypothetical protein